MAILVRLRTAYAKLDARVFAALGLAAVFVALGGIYWDVTWHATIGRDSFWITPHLLVYSGVGVSLLSALGRLTLMWQRTSSLRAALFDRGGLGFAVAALGPIVQVAAAPLDNLWHVRYGLDVTVWSPPHLMGIAGGMVGIYGLLAALGAEPRSRDARPIWRGVSATEVIGLLLFGAALSLSMFALAGLDFHLDRRDALFYPLLAGALAAVPLMGAARYVGRPGAATAVALVYVLFRSSVLLVVWAMGSYEHLSPPVLVLVPALAIDLTLWRTKGRGVLAAALLAGPALLAGEWGLRALSDAQGWEPLQVLASLAVVAMAVVAGALAGDRLGSLMRPEDEGSPYRGDPVEDRRAAPAAGSLLSKTPPSTHEANGSEGVV